jgi:hypothetical protein
MRMGTQPRPAESKFRLRRDELCALCAFIQRAKAMTESSKRGAESTFGRAMAASGATLLALVFSATSLAAVSWALVRLLSLPNFVLWGLLVLSALPVVWVTVWTAGRAWHVETRLSGGLDVDQPVFKLAHYFRKR